MSDKESNKLKVEAETTIDPSKIETEVLLATNDKKPVIVIDPGHGYTKKDTGSASVIYVYKTKDANGRLNGKTAKANIEELPQYVLDDLTLIHQAKSKQEDYDRPERALVFDISLQLKNIMEKEGYKILLTRDKSKIEGIDDKITRNERIKLANDNKADYFISIHADGCNSIYDSGAHAIYPKVSDKDVVKYSKELAEDIYSSYTVVPVQKESPKKDVRGLQVLNDTNETKRKVILELGFIKGVKDARALFTNKSKVAEQIKDGLVKNIKKYFKE